MERKRKRSQQNASPKRRKAERRQPREQRETETDPYPLENKFVDDRDRATLMQMSEIMREAILARRQDEIRLLTDKRRDEEDGQTTKYDEEKERDRRLLVPAPEEEPPITLEDLKSCRLPRAHITRYCMAPWFDEFVKGTWVRYLIGVENDSNQPGTGYVKSPVGLIPLVEVAYVK
ncbi:hypothetical protein C8Q74DRAFT_960075 [Fomes fomentarius]|nr:hypothetical protein C8Q74DRAFT_960075 [Fomes fomentarius]